MNPIRPPIPPRPYSSEAVPNPLYGMHVNAAVAGPSTQRVHPRANSSPTSFYPSHLAQQTRAPQPPPLLPNPTSLTSHLPPSLMPGRGGRSRPETISSLESSLFFQPNTAPFPPPLISTTHPKSLAQAQHAPSSSRPSLPPKPRVQTQSPTGPGAASSALNGPLKQFTASEQPTTVSVAPQSPHSADEEELIARALELSLRESAPVGKSDLEDEILARVLEESLAPNGSSNMRNGWTYHDTSSPRQLDIKLYAGPLSTASSSASSSSSSIVETPATSACYDADGIDHDSLRHPSTSIDLGKLTKQEEELIWVEDEARRRQLEMDEEFARSIALLEADSASPSSDYLYNAMPKAARPSSLPVASSLQRPSNLHGYFPPPPVSSESRPLPIPMGSTGLARNIGSYSASVSPSPSVAPFDKLGRSMSAQAAIPSVSEGASSSSSTPVDRQSVRPNDVLPNTMIPVQHRRYSASPVESPSTPKVRPKLDLDGLKRALSAGKPPGLPPFEEVGESDITLSPTMSPTSIDEPDEGKLVSNSSSSSAPIVEEELLLGVSFGFNAPPMTSANEPMQGPIPNIITLPYGKCPPLHIQAPSWKDLLKLLTRLSDSRIEPTVEALAGTKSDLKLRTVVQFMKLQHASDDWRTIVYLTIDTPLPPSSPNLFKYTNGDVNTLPYSYTMSPLPALLRVGSGDSNLSKCFTVPATANTPYPTLPMSLPDFAMYLHAILEDSRRAANDSSGGLRRLAKAVDTLYPADSLEGVGPEIDLFDKRGVGKFFRRALGRGSKDTQPQRGGNAERFEFITPFRIDEYR